MNSTLFLTTTLALLAAVSAGIMTGGVSEYNPSLDSNEVQTAIDLLNDHLADTENEDYLERTGVRVVSATSQVVSGVRYTYTLEVTGGSSGLNEECTFAVWSRVWLPEPENNILSGEVSCTPIEE